MADKIYCGNAKVVVSKFGDITKISMSRSDLEVLKKRETKNSFTHSVSIDTWKPEGK